ncbi:hypothetical protein BCR34DRAFT_142276 [Clohesyomyces aquaticus]|uniref:Uncharacterized protein n=1 Tax=Clohesyomyces aquaticus TaxID=1231657 RepID=A0A1Y1YM83_9PLEO|nr:hypothetical protein BCR34DRAFT_142276 [Clohesyomyces aquaticus]
MEITQREKPLRMAIIGLSAAAVTSWASTAHLPNFQTSAGKARFKITALLNSSTSAAEAAIDTYKLEPATVQAYGSAAALAQDANVDFVVASDISRLAMWWGGRQLRAPHWWRGTTRLKRSPCIYGTDRLSVLFIHREAISYLGIKRHDGYKRRL